MQCSKRSRYTSCVSVLKFLIALVDYKNKNTQPKRKKTHKINSIEWGEKVVRISFVSWVLVQLFISICCYYTYEIVGWECLPSRFILLFFVVFSLPYRRITYQLIIFDCHRQMKRRKQNRRNFAFAFAKWVAVASHGNYWILNAI